MSVIENPLAYLNETNDVEYNKTTPVVINKHQESSTNSNLLDDTPLTTDKEKSRSPRQLNQPDNDDVQNESGTFTLADKKPGEKSIDIIKQYKSANPNSGPLEHEEIIGNIEHETGVGNIIHDTEEIDKLKLETEEGGQSAANEPVIEERTESKILKLAEDTGSDSEDADFIPLDEVQDLSNDEQGEVRRQYSLRDGVKGAAKETVSCLKHDYREQEAAHDVWSAFKADIAIPIKRKAKELENAVREKAYDFAGETVTVREQIYNKRKSILNNKTIVSTLALDRKRRRESAPIVSSPQNTRPLLEAEGASTSAPYTKRHVSKLGSIVNRLSKKPKLNVLSKTELDWKAFKNEKGITDDVKNEAKKEGYLEKQDFLSRTDQRQFELEKDIRIQQHRRRQMMNSKQL